MKVAVSKGICEKCGNADAAELYMRFHGEGQRDCSFDERWGSKLPAHPKDEHLLIHCRRCSYSWTVRTWGAVRPEEPPE